MSVRLDEDGGGFSLAIESPAGTFEETTFRPAGEAGVFEPAQERGLLALFTGDRFGDDAERPLVGAPVVWSRTTADSLHLYRLTLDDEGRTSLERFVLSAGPAMLSVSRLQVEGGEASVAEAPIEKDLATSLSVNNARGLMKPRAPKMVPRVTSARKNSKPP